MFQNLRENSQLYILTKSGAPALQTATVVSVSKPVPKYAVPPVFGQPQEMVVDVVANVQGQQTTYQKLPAGADIADFANGIVISDSRDAMLSEVNCLKQKSIEAINSVDFHNGVISGCDVILKSLNPEYAERQRQQAEIDSLKEQMAEMLKINKELIAVLKPETSSS